MTTRRTPLKIAAIGFLLRELCRVAIRLADAMDPAGTAPGWTAPPKPAEPVVPDRIPDALLVRW